jgi:hypothetical protein
VYVPFRLPTILDITLIQPISLKETCPSRIVSVENIFQPNLREKPHLAFK